MNCRLVSEGRSNVVMDGKCYIPFDILHHLDSKKKKRPQDEFCDQSHSLDYIQVMQVSVGLTTL